MVFETRFQGEPDKLNEKYSLDDIKKIILSPDAYAIVEAINNLARVLKEK